MKINNFENSAHHTNALPVEHAAAAVDSNSPAALPTVAPDALLCPTRAALDARWHGDPKFNAANRAWHELLNHLAAFYPAPQLN